MRDSAARPDQSVRTRRGGWLVFGAFAALAMGCATSGATARGAFDPAHLPPAHPEPELVSELPKVVKHRVEPGQTLYRIARTYDISVDALMQANGITDPRTLAVGQELLIPGAARSLDVIPPGAQEAPDAVAAQQQGTTASPARAEDDPPAPSPRPQARREKQEPVVMPTGEGQLDWPLRGVLYARFGKKGRERHDGIDLAAPAGSPVMTAKPGTVLYAGEQKGYGQIAIIDHGDDLITLYAHNRDLRVRTGQKVRDGQVIATVGESGRTSGPHLHFEVRKGGLPVDPLKFLGAPPDKRAMGRKPREETR